MQPISLETEPFRGQCKKIGQCPLLTGIKTALGDRIGVRFSGQGTSRIESLGVQ